MTFFYDLNKRLADLAVKQDLNESKVAESERWIQKAVNPKTKGNLHKALHVAQDETIPKAKIEKATHSKNPKLRHMAQFAKNVAHEEIEQEGNAFTGALAKTPKGSNFKLGNKEFKDTSSIEEGTCPTCNCAPCSCNEGNEFSGALAHAKMDHKSEFEVDGKKYKVVEADPTGLGEDEMDEGFEEMNAWLKSREKEQGTGNFDKRERTLPSGMKATTYTRRHEDDVEDDSDAPASKGGAPKKRGRPMGKPKGPERVTKGAWKHKAGRVANEEETDEGWRGGMLGEPSVVKTGKKDPNAKVEAWNGLMAIVARGEGMEPAVLKHLKQIARTLKPEELELDEEKVEAGKREFFDKIAPAAKKASKLIKSLSKGKEEVEEKKESTAKKDTKAEKAGKKVAKDIEYDEGHKGKDDNKAEKAGKKVTKDIEYDDKKDAKEKKTDKEEKVDETTVAGSVATASTNGKSNKGGINFGGSVYENFNNSVEKMITESVTIESTMAECGDGEINPGITIQADGEDAEKLMMLLKLAGLDSQLPSAEVVDENSPDWPTNTETLATEPNLRTYSGGLNGPKSTGQTTTVGGGIPNAQLRRQVSMEESVELERTLFKTWKNYKG